MLQVKNRAKSTLASDITATDTSLSVATGDGTKFPSKTPFHITIDDEIMEVTGTSGDTFTIGTRGAEGTTATAHNAGAVVELNVTAAIIQELQDGKLSAVVDDTSPQLGGELDAGAHSIGFTQQAITSSSGAATIDWKLGNKASITLTENVTFTFNAPSNPGNLILVMIQDSTGGRTATWPSNVKWVGGTAPTLSTAANAVDIIAFYFDGTNYYGQASLNFS